MSEVIPGGTAKGVTVIGVTDSSGKAAALGGATGVPLLVDSTSGANTATPGSAVPAKAMQVSGTDGTNARVILLDTTGRTIAAESGSTGSAVPTRAEYLGVIDGSGNLIGLKGASALADGDTTGMLAVAPESFNGATFDRLRSNVEGTALTSAARTATTTSATLTNHNARGVLIYLNQTVVSGTGSVTVTVQGIDPVSGAAFDISAGGTAQSAVVGKTYFFYPGTTGSGGASVQLATTNQLPRSWRIKITHSDGSSMTYSVGYALTL